MNLKQFLESNKLSLKESIDFEIDRYGDWIPSVTTILQLIHNPWLEFVKRNYKEKLEEAVKLWTKVHKQAEEWFDKGGEINSNIVTFHNLMDVKIVAQESTWFYGNKDIPFRWSIDLECIINWIEYNVDYKNTIVQSPLYKLQLWWYQLLNWKEGMIVYVKDKLKIVKVESYYKDIFYELLNLFYKYIENGNYIGKNKKMV